MLLRLGPVRFHINMWNPLYATAPFFLLFISIPLAIFAIFTTSIAVTLLSLRAFAVYFQLAIAVVGIWLFPPPPKTSPSLRTHPSTPSPPARHNRHRRRSSAGLFTPDATTPGTQNPRLHTKSDSFSTLVGTSGIARDFESVGGWRNTGDEEEEALWMGINSRYQLPPEVPTRRHRRSLTGPETPDKRRSWSPEALRMSPVHNRSPVQSRARTPVRFILDDEDEQDYFPPQPLGGHRLMSSASDAARYGRRKSSSSSTSSTLAPTNSALKEEEE